jgi:hypothetical protein
MRGSVRLLALSVAHSLALLSPPSHHALSRDGLLCDTASLVCVLALSVTVLGVILSDGRCTIACCWCSYYVSIVLLRSAIFCAAGYEAEFNLCDVYGTLAMALAVCSGTFELVVQHIKIKQNSRGGEIELPSLLMHPVSSGETGRRPDPYDADGQSV